MYSTCILLLVLLISTTCIQLKITSSYSRVSQNLILSLTLTTLYTVPFLPQSEVICSAFIMNTNATFNKGLLSF